MSLLRVTSREVWVEVEREEEGGLNGGLESRSGSEDVTTLTNILLIKRDYLRRRSSQNRTILDLVWKLVSVFTLLTTGRGTYFLWVHNLSLISTFVFPIVKYYNKVAIILEEHLEL